MGRVDQAWPRLSFATPWSSAREERDRVRLALERFLDWHQANPRQLIAAERKFTADVQLSSGEAIRIRGTIDRLEIDAQGALVVVDLKTGRRSISAKSVEADPQLALYQLAITDGDAVAEGAITGGAEIVQLASTTVDWLTCRSAALGEGFNIRSGVQRGLGASSADDPR